MAAAYVYPITDVPPAPPTPPAGYDPTIAYSLFSDVRGLSDPLEQFEWSARRLKQPNPRLDFTFAVRLLAEHGVKTYQLQATVYCKTVDEEGEPGTFGAVSIWEAESIYPQWSPWLHDGDMRSPAWTLERMHAEGYKTIAELTAYETDRFLER